MKVNKQTLWGNQHLSNLKGWKFNDYEYKRLVQSGGLPVLRDEDIVCTIAKVIEQWSSDSF